MGESVNDVDYNPDEGMPSACPNTRALSREFIKIGEKWLAATYDKRLESKAQDLHRYACRCLEVGESFRNIAGFMDGSLAEIMLTNSNAQSPGMVRMRAIIKYVEVCNEAMLTLIETIDLAEVGVQWSIDRNKERFDSTSKMVESLLNNIKLADAKGNTREPLFDFDGLRW